MQFVTIQWHWFCGLKANVQRPFHICPKDIFSHTILHIYMCCQVIPTKCKCCVSAIDMMFLQWTDTHQEIIASPLTLHVMMCLMFSDIQVWLYRSEAYLTSPDECHCKQKWSNIRSDVSFHLLQSFRYTMCTISWLCIQNFLLNFVCIN